MQVRIVLDEFCDPADHERHEALLLRLQYVQEFFQGSQVRILLQDDLGGEPANAGVHLLVLERVSVRF